LPAFHNTTTTGWIAAALLLASVGAAASQANPARDPLRPTEPQPRILDDLRQQRQRTDQQLGEDLRRQQDQLDARRRQIEIEDRLRRKQIQDQLERRK
jgi:hypothetical protein